MRVVPGFVEIDLVGHEGGNAVGEHAYTLTVTDIATGGRRTGRCRTRPESGWSRHWRTSPRCCRSRCLGLTLIMPTWGLCRPRHGSPCRADRRAAGWERRVDLGGGG